MGAAFVGCIERGVLPGAGLLRSFAEPALSPGLASTVVAGDGTTSGWMSGCSGGAVLISTPDGGEGVSAG